MDTIKKIGLWLAFMTLIIIKTPITLLTSLICGIELLLIKLNRKVVVDLDDESVIEGFNTGLKINSRSFDQLSYQCFDMKIEL